MTKTLVVLAAGIGSRYGGLKQMDPMGPSGEFIVDYSIFDAVLAGFDNIVFVIRRDIENAFRSIIGARTEKLLPTKYVCQELSNIPKGFSISPERKKPWGTGHAVLTCADMIDGPFAVINADDFYGRESYAVLSRFLQETSKNESQYCMIGFILRNTLSDYGSVARGICSVGPNGCLESIAERTKIEKKGDKILCEEQFLSGEEFVSMNMWGFKPSIFRYLEDEFHHFLEISSNDSRAEFFMPDMVNKLITKRRVSVKVLKTGCSWFGITNPKDKFGVVESLRDLVQAGEYPRDLHA